MRILVVDDELDITYLFEDYLTELGHTVFTATSSEAVEKIFTREEINVILLDINTPRVSGLQLFQFFKKCNPDVIVVMVIGIHDVDMMVKCIQMGVYDYLVKPIINLN